MSKEQRCAEQMYELVRSYRTRTKTKTAFCQEHGIKPSTLSYWVTRYNRSEGKEKQPPLFTPVRYTAPSSGPIPPGCITVRLCCGIELSLPDSALSEAAAAFIRLLARQ